MNGVYKHYVIDLSCNNNFVQVPAVQGDGGENVRVFEVELISNNVQYKVDPENTTVTIAGTKPDTKQILNKCEVTEDGYIIVNITQQMAAVPGRGDYCIALIDNNSNSLLQSFPFYILVTKSAFDGAEIVSSNEFTLLTEKINAVEKIDATIKENEQARQEAEGKRVEAEGKRQEAEGKRVEAEGKRQEAEQKRQTDTATMIQNANQAIADKIKDVNDATNNAITNLTNATNTAIQNTNKATADAIVATNNANQATHDAIDATSGAQTATSDAITATQNANTATANANTAATNANNAISGVAALEQSLTNAESVRVRNENDRIANETQRQQDTLTAINNVNTAATNANNAATRADNISTDLENKLASGYFNGKDGKDGKDGDVTVTTINSNQLAFSIIDGDLFLIYQDGNTNANHFYLNKTTGELFYYVDEEPPLN